jgi:hypothetical protein
VRPFAVGFHSSRVVCIDEEAKLFINHDRLGRSNQLLSSALERRRRLVRQCRPETLLDCVGQHVVCERALVWRDSARLARPATSSAGQSIGRDMRPGPNRPAKGGAAARPAGASVRKWAPSNRILARQSGSAEFRHARRRAGLPPTRIWSPFRCDKLNDARHRAMRTSVAGAARAH